jgi:ankyrin repeat protein
MRLLAVAALLAPALAAQTSSEIRASAAKALPILQRSTAAFIAKRACVSCHHNILSILAFDLGRKRGFAIDSAVLRAVEEKTFHGLQHPGALDEAIQATTLNDPTPDESYLLIAAKAAGLPPDLTTGVYARRLLSWQREGHWVTSDFRPPHSSSMFTATATAIRAIRQYLPEELRAEGEAGIRRARQWLVTASPASTEDATFRLLGLEWAGAAAAEVAAASADLWKLQKPAGGWAELPDYPADAYSTGEALYALHAAGTPADAALWRKGLRYLMATQAPEGTWRVHTRMLSPASVSPAYFSTGFPYQKDEYLSYAGTCWAVMALLAALPEQPAAPVSKQKTLDDSAPWIRTALFGSAPQLAALLDGGLDPNTRTENGTTLLMMAAPDAAKVRLLLARGAGAEARASSGVDALTIAAAYRGTAESLHLLLDAGAPVQPPKGTRVHYAPLVLASMSGDLANVRLLLAHGADPSAAAADTALAQAVTFGYADIAEALIAAGASATLKESNGINLLHWAVIANRPELIPILARAGAQVNATDEHGFTPLMYAATIDFGDTRSVKALLAAGADPAIPNEEGRTPRQQAHYFHHNRLEAALR